jgi:hypothetical protein
MTSCGTRPEHTSRVVSSIQPHAITFFGDEPPCGVVPFDELFAVTLQAETDGQRVRLDVCDATSIEIESDAGELIIGDLLANLLAHTLGRSDTPLQLAVSSRPPRPVAHEWHPGLGL